MKGYVSRGLKSGRVGVELGVELGVEVGNYIVVKSGLEKTGEHP